MQAQKPTGYVIYNGPSLLDGKPIIVVAITKSTNRKTGDMVQTYILRSDIAPVLALKSGDDSSICGDCKHRPILGGACYVNVGQGPRAVFEAFSRGRYPQSPDKARELSAGRMVRLGTYGDPAAVPAQVWENLIGLSAGHTGYSHQWQNPALPAEHRARISALCMASADTENERARALALGFRTFRVRLESSPVLPGEFVCPASDEGGKRRTCDTCKACDGTARGPLQASPVIVVHGSKAGRFSRVISAI
jgi:hypothetical protein